MLDGGVRLAIVRDKLAGVGTSSRGVLLNEVDEGEGMGAVAEVEVHTFGVSFDRDGIFVHFVLEDELFEEEKGTLVLSSLTNLNDGVPLRLAGGDLGAELALLPGNNKLNLIRLLDDSVLEELLLEGELELEALGVGFGPQELSVGQVELSETLDLFEADGHELAGLEGGTGPELGRLEVAIAFGAVDKDVFFDQVSGDVDVGLDAADTHVGWVFRDDQTANTALDLNRFGSVVLKIHFFVLFLCQ